MNNVKRSCKTAGIGTGLKARLLCITAVLVWFTGDVNVDGPVLETVNGVLKGDVVDACSRVWVRVSYGERYFRWFSYLIMKCIIFTMSSRISKLLWVQHKMSLEPQSLISQVILAGPWLGAVIGYLTRYHFVNFLQLLLLLRSLENIMKIIIFRMSLSTQCLKNLECM